MSLKPNIVTNLQFSSTKYEPDKLRRLNEEVARIQGTVNALIAALAVTEDAGTVAVHDFLGVAHALSGLTAGTYLKAINADSAAFDAINLADVADVDTTEAGAGDVLTVQADGSYGFASLPDLTGLADPGGNRLVWWDESDNELSYLLIGTGLQIVAGELRVTLAPLQHSALSGLGADDHPQYTAHQQNELISALWRFTAGVDLSNPTEDTLQTYFIGIDGEDLVLQMVGSTEQSDLLRITRLDDDLIDTVTWGNERGLRMEINGSLFIPRDDEGLYLGETGGLRLYRNEEYAELESSDELHIEAPTRLDLTTDLLETNTAESVLADPTAIENAGRWTASLTEGRLSLGAYFPDYGGEDWLAVDVLEDEIDTVDIRGHYFTFNGARILTEDDGGGAAYLDELLDVIAPSPSVGDALMWNGADWVNQSPPGAAGGETNTASNLGSGSQWYASKSGVDLRFRTIVQGTGISVTQAATEITVAGLPQIPIISDSTTTRTIALAELGSIVRFSNASAITYTIPLNASVAAPVTSVVGGRQVGAGQVTIAATGGVVLNVPDDKVAKTRALGSFFALHKAGTDEWDLTGDLEDAP